MKKRFNIGLKIIFSILAFSGAASSRCFSQFSFSASPGMGMNCAAFGYKISDHFVPHVGFQYLNASFNYEDTKSEGNNGELSGNLYIPGIGVKYLMKDYNKIKPYFILDLSKPYLRGKLKEDGEEDGEFSNTLKDIKMFGAQAGFGVEYFLDKNFSVGGEFDLRYIHFKYNWKSKEDLGYDDEDEEYNYKLVVSPTVSRFSLNFYF